jgi:hypothetical protein
MNTANMRAGKQGPRMMIFIYGTLIAATALPASACDLCSVYAATEAQGGSGKGLFAGLAEQFTRFGTVQIDGRDAANPGSEFINSSISQVFGGYNFSDRAGIQLSVPVIYREYGAAAKHGSDFGIGDLSLLGQVKLFEHEHKHLTMSWNVLGGVKFPTGASGHLNPNEADFSSSIGNHDLTLGSGSFDGLLGSDVFARWKRLFLTAGVQYAVRSEGSYEYQFANDWIWYGGPGVYLALGDYTLAIQLVASGENKGQDNVRGIATDDTATSSVFLGPQINFTWSSSLSAHVGVDIPVSIVSSGQQIVADYRLHSALIWRF